MAERRTHNSIVAGSTPAPASNFMAKVNQKNIRELLEQYTETRGAIENLQAQRDAALEPARAKMIKAVEKIDREFAPQISPLSEQLVRLETSIKAEMQKGFDAAANSYAVVKVESTGAIVEVSGSQRREISAEDWLREVPKAEQSKSFFGTISVLVVAAEKFRSDIVNRIASVKRSHQISIRLK